MKLDKTAKAHTIAGMFGVCVTTAAGGHDNFKRWDDVADALNALGATWVRTSMVGLNTAPQVAYLKTLIRKCDGLKFQCIIGKGNTPAEQIERYLRLIAGDGALRDNVVRVEGANEWNLSGKRNDPNPGWAGQLENHQRHLYEKAKRILGDQREVAGFSIGNPTSGDKGWPSYDKLFKANCNRNFDNVMDIGNVHLYIGGQLPERRKGLERVLQESRRLYGSRLMYTETGFHDFADSTTHKYTPRAVAGEYLPRLILDYFKRGIEMLSLYELVDDGKPRTGDKAHEPHFGLYYVDTPDGRPFRRKPAGNAFQHLHERAFNSWLGPGRSAKPAEWERTIQIQKDTSVDSVETVLLRGDRGRALLCLWRPDTSRFNHETGDDPVPVGKKTIRLKFPVGMNFKVYCFDEATWTASNQKLLALKVDARVLCIEIEPAGAG